MLTNRGTGRPIDLSHLTLWSSAYRYRLSRSDRISSIRRDWRMPGHKSWLATSTVWPRTVLERFIRTSRKHRKNRRAYPRKIRYANGERCRRARRTTFRCAVNCRWSVIGDVTYGARRKIVLFYTVLFHRRVWWYLIIEEKCVVTLPHRERDPGGSWMWRRHHFAVFSTTDQ